MAEENGNSFPILVFSLEVFNKKGEFNEEYFESQSEPRMILK